MQKTKNFRDNKFLSRFVDWLRYGVNTGHAIDQRLTDNLTRRLAKLSGELICYDLGFPDFLRGVRFALSLQSEAEMMTVEQNPTLRRKSMELLKELTQILQEIIRSGDEESLRRLEETIRTIDGSRRKSGRTLH